MRILIVGGGIAGLAAARALAGAGFQAEIVERATAPRVRGAGIYLPGNGMAALDRLGLASAVAAQGAPVLRRRVFDERGRSLIDFDEAALWRDVAVPIALDRSDLHRILAEGATGTPIRYGTSVTGVTEDGDRLDATFDDGTSSSYDLLIGADGGGSWVRQHVLGGRPARPAGQVGWRFVVDGVPGIDGWNGWLGPDRGLLALGIGEDRVYGVGDLRATDRLDPTRHDLDAFRRLFDGYPEPAPTLLGRLRTPDDLWFAPFEEVAPPSWGRGRIVLVGDAAHATAPNMAEGASLAIEDALVLAETLSSGAGLAESLRAFAERRTPRIAWVQRMTRRRDRLRYLSPTLRRGVMRVAGHRIFRAHYHPLLEAP